MRVMPARPRQESTSGGGRNCRMPALREAVSIFKSVEGLRRKWGTPFNMENEARQVSAAQRVKATKETLKGQRTEV